MRLNADRLATEGLRLEMPSPHSETPNLIELGPSREVSGTYQHGLERLEIRGVRGGELGVRSFEWHFASGDVRLDGGATLREVLVDLTIDRTATDSGLGGTIACGAGEIGRAILTFGAIEIAASVRVEGFEYVAAPGGELLLKAASIDLRETSIRWEGGSAEIGALDFKHAQLRLKDDERTLELHTATIGEVKARVGDTAIEIHGGAIPRGLRWSEGLVELGELLADRIVIDVADVAGTAPEPPPISGPRTEPGKRSGTAPIDLGFLDGLHGQIDVDLRAVTDIPVVGRRDKTHQFRIPVRQGELNYRSLERDLGTLEDAFIDIEVRDGKLSIENDIPLLPFYYRSLVLFRIPPEDLAKAQDDRLVKLRTFAEWELPPPSDRSKRKKRKKSSGSPVDIVALDFENIDIALGLDRAAHIDLGALGSLQLGGTGVGGTEVAPLGALTLRGAVRYRPSSEAQPGELLATVDGVSFGLQAMRLGTQVLSVTSARLDAVESARLKLTGVRPGRLRVEARGLDLDGFSLWSEPIQELPPSES